MATIKEIARLAGVSRGTVDRVINNRGTVKKETAEKVQSIAKSLNYFPNKVGKALAVSKKQLRFGYILFSNAEINPFFIEVVKGIKRAAKDLLEYGVNVEILYAKIDNPDLQVALINKLVDEGIDGIALIPINHPLVARRVRQLTESGLAVVTANSDIPTCGRLAYVGSNAFRSGCAAAGLMNMATGGCSNVGIVIGNPLLDCHTERVAGFKHQVHKVYSGIRIIDSISSNDDDALGFSVTKHFLQKNPETDALFLAGAGVFGVCQAVKEMGLCGKIKIISYDLTPKICELISEGVISATITQDPFMQGRKPLQVLFDYVGMGRTPQRELFYTNIEIKIQENIF